MDRKYQSLPELVASSCQFQLDCALPPLRFTPTPQPSRDGLAKLAPYNRGEMGDSSDAVRLTEITAPEAA